MSDSFHNKIIPSYVEDNLRTDLGLSEDELAQIEKAWEASAQFKYPESNIAENWQKLSAKMQQPTKEVRVFPLYKWLSVAAVLLIAFTFFVWKNNVNNITNISLATDKRPMSYTLSEGTVIKANSNSNLQISLTNNNRKVKIEGEAFFNVTHNKTPFIVETNYGTVTVMGTQFNVKAYPNKALEIALLEGKISFENKHSKETIFLEPGESIILNNDAYTKVKNINSMAWVTHQLVFDNKPLLEIIESLEKLYNVKFEYDKSLNSEQLSITIDNLSATQAAELLSKTIGKEIKVK